MSPISGQQDGGMRVVDQWLSLIETQCYASSMNDRAEYMRRWYQNNKEAHKARVAADRRRRRKSRRDMVAELKSVPCADCGIQYPPYVMDFDHRGDKLFEISDITGRDGSLDRFLTEIAKCDVVCSNCHRERTHGSQV